MMNTLSDPRPDGLLVVEYPYFETATGTTFTTTEVRTSTTRASWPNRRPSSSTTAWERS